MQAFFNGDHREIHRLIDDTRQAVSAGVEGPFEEFRRRLELHIRWEEEFLFPVVTGKSPLLHGASQVMRVEHAEIRGVLAEVRRRLDAGDPPGASDLLGALAHILADHNAKEEQVFYPESEAHLTSREWGRMLEAIRALRPAPGRLP